MRSVLLLALLLPTILLATTLPADAQYPQIPSAIVWQRTWGGNNYEQGSSVTTDAAGNVYLTGYTTTFGLGNGDVFLLKYNSSGGLVFQRTWGGIQNEVGTGIAVNSSGDIYVTGYSNSFGAGGTDAITLKFNSTGGLVWQRTWGGSRNDAGYGIAVDPSDSVYVVGETSSTGAGQSDAFILKLNATGGLVWERTWGGNNADSASGVAVDPSGAIYVAGSTLSFGVGLDNVFLLKFDALGNLLWQGIWGLAGYGPAFGTGVSLDSSGNIYVVGSATDTADIFSPFNRILLMKFNSTGFLLWDRTWGDSSDDQGQGVAVGASSAIYVVGHSSNGDDAILLVYNPYGNLLRQRRWASKSSGIGVAADSNGDDIATGTIASYPPYSASPVNGRLSAPNGLPSLSGNDTLGLPIISAQVASGVVGLPSGSQNYSGGSDAFVLEYNSLLVNVHFHSEGGYIDFNGTSYCGIGYGYICDWNGDYLPGNYTTSAQPYAYPTSPSPGTYPSIDAASLSGSSNQCSSTAAKSGFQYWDASGGVAVMNATQNPTVVKVVDDGGLSACMVPFIGAITPWTIILSISFVVTATVVVRRGWKPEARVNRMRNLAKS